MQNESLSLTVQDADATTTPNVNGVKDSSGTSSPPSAPTGVHRASDLVSNEGAHEQQQPRSGDGGASSSSNINNEVPGRRNPPPLGTITPTVVAVENTDDLPESQSPVRVLASVVIPSSSSGGAGSGAAFVSSGAFGNELTPSEYIQKHKLKETMDVWLGKLGDKQPENPLEELLSLVQAKIEESHQYLVCENHWCEAKVKLSEYQDHLAICSPQRWHKCIRCDERVDNDKMEQHRKNCTLVSCPQCGEYVFRRMLPLCPHLLLQQPPNKNSTPQSLTPQATPPPEGVTSGSATPAGNLTPQFNTLRPETYTPEQFSAHDLNIRKLQALWRTFHARTKFQNLAFRLVWDRMEFARETKLATGVSSSEKFRYSSWTGRRSSYSNLNGMLAAGSGGGGGVSGGASHLMGGYSPGVSPMDGSLRAARHTSHGSFSSFSFKGSGGEGSPAGKMKPEDQTIAEVVAAHPLEDLQEIMEMVEGNKQLADQTAEDLIRDATKILRIRPTVCNITTPFGGEVVIVGDLHGQIKDLLHILDSEGLPNEHKYYVFNGDFVDRGPNGCEVLFLLFALVCTFPQFVYLTRGNHEDRNTNREYGFMTEVTTKYEDAVDLFDGIVRTYKAMPLVHLLDEKVFIVHGGLPRTIVPISRLNTLGHVRDIPCADPQDEDDELVVDLTWSDPVERFKSRALGLRASGKNWRHSSRGCGVEYTTDHTKDFLELNSLNYVVRSHEMVPGGYQVLHDGKSITVFSASDYCGVSQNRGAVVIFSHGNTEPQFRTWFLKEEKGGGGGKKRRRGVDTPDLQPLSIALKEQEQSVSEISSLAASGSSDSLSRALIGLEKKDCLNQIQEIIWNNRFRLMSSFSAADVTQVGYVTKVEWSEVMRRVSNLPLPWYFICPYLVEVVLYQEIPAVNYTQFLMSIDTLCGAKYKAEWVKVKVFDLFKSLNLPDDFIPPNSAIEKRKSSVGDFLPTRSVDPPAAASSSGFQSGIQSAFGGGGRGGGGVMIRGRKDWTSILLDFNAFATTIRAKAHSAAAIPDNMIFVLFTYFDTNRDGQVSLGELVRVVEALIDEVDEEDEVVEVEEADHIVKKGEDHTQFSRGNYDEDDDSGSDLDSNSGDRKKKGGKKEKPKGWIFESMMLLQQFFLFGQRRGLESIFSTLDREGTGILGFDDFKRLWRRLNKQLQTPLTEDQLEEMFAVVDVDGSGGIDIGEFVSYFSVKDMRTGAWGLGSGGSPTSPPRGSVVERLRQEMAGSATALVVQKNGTVG